jgi:uridine kinase
MSLVVGIAGGSASGKTTVAEKLRTSLIARVIRIQHDSYYKASHHLSIEERAKQNYDHPNALDTGELVQAIKDLKAGKEVGIPTYDFTLHNRTNTLTLEAPGDIIIVEGILLFENEELRDLMDIRVFVETDDDLRFIRRLERDVEERDRTVQSVIQQWTETVKPMHRMFVEPSKRYADIIIPFETRNNVGMDVLVSSIASKLVGRVS